MLLYIRPFDPKGVPVTLAVTASSQAVAVTRPGVGTQTVRIVVSGTDPVFFVRGTSTVVSSTTTGTPMLGNTVETFLLPNDITHIAFISTGTASTVYVTTGESA